MQAMRFILAMTLVAVECREFKERKIFMKNFNKKTHLSL